MIELELMRIKIDEIDDKLLVLFKERLEVSKKIGLLKKKHNIKIFDPQREQEIIDNCTQNVSDDEKKYIEKLEIKSMGEKQKVAELSGGNQQKVCVAKAFTMEPDLLFVSEPTRGIDVGAKQLVLETLKEYNRERNTTIVVTSSEIEELRSICDRIAIINEGKVAGILPATASILDFGKLMSGIKEGE